jgi:REP element-mobilizing transposase RayT
MGDHEGRPYEFPRQTPAVYYISHSRAMPYNPLLHHRRSIRLPGYDYAQAGLYFITIVTQRRECRFGQVVNDAMQLNDAGLMLERHWAGLPARFPNICMEEYQIMPNHLHGIIRIADPESFPGNCDAEGKNIALGNMLGAFKSEATNAYIRGVKELNWPPFDRKLLQRNYWEHIIRTEEDYRCICRYMANNPANWAKDSLCPP